MNSKKKAKNKSLPLENESGSLISNKRKRSVGNGDTILERKRKSLRLQHSMSLHIPMEEIDRTALHMNCYIELDNQNFNLTYLGDNETHNPNSLECLEMLKKKKWQSFLVGTLYNFSYKPDEMESLGKVIERTLATEYQDLNNYTGYHVEVSASDDFNPTDNDNKALEVRVIGLTEEKETLLYEGYLLSWCNPQSFNGVLLPVLLSVGKRKVQELVHVILKERLDIDVIKLQFTQEEFLRLSTYCVVMLNKNDSYNAKFIYEHSTGTMSIEVTVESLLNLWSNIHTTDSIEVELDEILLFNQAFESSVESSFGVNLDKALLQSVIVFNCFALHRNGQMKFTSTKIIHVVLKYLNHLAVQRLKLKALNRTMEINSCSSRSLTAT